VKGLFFFNGGAVSHDEGYRVLNLDFEGGGVAQTGVVAGNDVSDISMCNLTINAFSSGVYVAGSNNGGTVTGYCTGSGSLGDPYVCPGQQARISLRGSTITNNAQMGYLGGCDQCSVQYNHFEFNGGTDASVHGIYYGGVEPTVGGVTNEGWATGEIIQGNEIIDSRPSGGSCNGVQLVVHGSHNRMQITDNTLQITGGHSTGGCYGISAVSGNPYAESIKNLLIARNTIISPGYIGIQVQTTQGAVIENNLILVDGPSTAAISSGQSFTSNSEDDDAPSPDGITQVTATGTIIRNNTVYFNDGSNSASRQGVFIGGGGRDYVVANNAIYNVSSSNGFQCYQFQAGSAVLTGGPISTTLSNYTGITNGAFDITINGVLRHITGINLSIAPQSHATPKSMNGVATAVKAALQTVIPGSFAQWTGTAVEITTAAATTATTITAASAPTTGGTDVSALLGLTAGTGATVGSTYASVDYNQCYAPSVSSFAWDNSTGLSFSSWKSALGFDTHSLNAAPGFTLSGMSGYDFTPATGSVLIGAGNATYGAATDYYNNTRPVPPDIGAFQHS